MSIVVTGATGQLGSLVVQHLLEKVPARDIAVCVRSPQKATTLAERGLDVRYGDYERQESLLNAFAGASRLLIISHPGHDQIERIRLHATAIEAAKKAGVGHIVYTSYAFLEKSPFPLAHTHLATEQMLQVTDIPFTILRNSPYREGYVNERVKADALESGEVLTMTGKGKLTAVTRSDLALAAATVLTEEGHENKLYELTTPEPWDFDEVAQLLSEFSGKQIVHRSAGEAEVRAYLTKSLAKSGVPSMLVEVILRQEQLIAEGARVETTMDLQRLIGPSLTSLRESVKQLF